MRRHSDRMFDAGKAALMVQALGRRTEASKVVAIVFCPQGLERLCKGYDDYVGCSD